MLDSKFYSKEVIIAYIITHDFYISTVIIFNVLYNHTSNT